MNELGVVVVVAVSLFVLYLAARFLPHGCTGQECRPGGGVPTITIRPEK